MNEDLKHLIWIDHNIDNSENQGYLEELKALGFSNFVIFKTVEEGINYIRRIRFESTKIILSGRIYIEFIKKFKEIINDLYIIPKIIIFTGSKEGFLKYNKNYMDIINDGFYNYGGIHETFDGIKNFLMNKILINKTKSIKLNEDNKLKFALENINNKEKLVEYKINGDTQLTFEYIDSLEKFELPFLYQSILEMINTNQIKKFNEYLYNTYSNQKKIIKELLYDIKDISNIPAELLCKYYIRLFTIESNFYKDINTDLRKNKKDNYLPYIKILYEGIKLKSLPLTSNKELYRGSFISIEEIDIIKNYLRNKNPNLPNAIVFSKPFLTFNKDINIAKNCVSNVLYILEKDDNIDYNLSTYCDIENLSIYQMEREVLFFPFSCFEIKDIKEIKFDNKAIYEIKLLYLGKYLKHINNNKNILQNIYKIPDSEFKKQILDLGLTQPETNQNDKKIKSHMKNYEEKLNNNIIKGILKISKIDLDEEMKILTSKEKDIEIKINNKKIESKCRYERDYDVYYFYYRFCCEGEYAVEYIFKKKLTYMKCMFSDSKSLISLDLSNINTENVTDMSYMFYSCRSLISLNLSNLNTIKVDDMSGMFEYCESLKSLDLSNFITKNVKYMDKMFQNCESLISLKLSNFSTKNVEIMSYMFSNCKSLKLLDLSNFDTKNVREMEDMFSNCLSLKSLNLSNFNTKNIKYLCGIENGIFSNCKSLISLDLSNFDTRNVKDINKIFNGCPIKKDGVKTSDERILKLLK